MAARRYAMRGDDGDLTMALGERVLRDLSPLAPTDSLRAAAEALGAAHAPLLPVCEPDGRIVGVLGERDLVDHGLARGLDAEARVLMVMNPYFDWCYEDEAIATAAARLADADGEALVVVDRAHRLVGLIGREALTPPARLTWDSPGFERRAA